MATQGSQLDADLATHSSPVTPPVPTTQDEGEELLTTTLPRTTQDEEDMMRRVALFQQVLSHLEDAATAWLIWLDPDESRIRREVDNLFTTIETFRDKFRSHLDGASEEYSSELSPRFHQLQLRVMALTTGHANNKLKRRHSV